MLEQTLEQTLEQLTTGYTLGQTRRRTRQAAKRGAWTRSGPCFALGTVRMWTEVLRTKRLGCGRVICILPRKQVDLLAVYMFGLTGRQEGREGEGGMWDMDHGWGRAAVDDQAGLDLFGENRAAAVRVESVQGRDLL
jgi:hypothetical protein